MSAYRSNRNNKILAWFVFSAYLGLGFVSNCAAQVAVFRYAANPTDPLNKVAISRYGMPGSQPVASPAVPDGVSLITDPAAVQNTLGHVFVVFLDNTRRMWAILFNGSTGAWGNWLLMGGEVNHRIAPAIALKTNELAYIAAIDLSGAVWINTLILNPNTLSLTSGGFANLGGYLGAYPARPAAAVTPDGYLHIFLRDGFNIAEDKGSFWVVHYDTRLFPYLGPFTWRGPLGSGIGTLSAVAGSGGTAYAALRDPWNGLWLLRSVVQPWSFTFWHSGGTIFTEPSAALINRDGVNRVYVAGGNGTAFYRRWNADWALWDGDWVSAGQPVAQVGLAAIGTQAYLVGQSAAGQLAWNPIDSGSPGWTAYQGTAAGAIASTPRDNAYSQQGNPPPPGPGSPDNVSVTWQPHYLGGDLMSATVDVPNGDAHTLRQVQLRLENANGQDFGCNLMARPDTGAMYLADDVGEWGPNERDRYTNGRNIKPGDPNTLPNWPNNSQCTLWAEGSSFQYSQNNQRVTVNFRVAFKSEVKGYLTVSMCSNFGDICAPLEDMGTFLAGNRTANPAVLHTGFKNASSTFKVLSESGNRELFFFRFHDPHGSQQLETVQINFSSNPNDPGPPSSSGCRVLVSPMTELLWLVGGFPQSAFAGTPGSLQNGQCTVHTASSKVQYLSPTEVLVRLDVGFGSNFTGRKYLHRSVDGFNWSNLGDAWYDVSFNSGFDDFPGFRDCVQSMAPSGTCSLKDGVHTVNQAIYIRGSKTLRGQSKYGAILKRGSSLPSEPMISVAPDGGPYFGIVISDLTIDGSRTGTTNTGVQDLSVLNVNGGTNPAGGFGIKIENCRFIDSGHSAIAMHPGYPGGPTYTKGIIIRKNEFRRSIRAPIHVSLGSIWWPTAPTSGFPQNWGGACDAAFPAEAPTDILVQNNFFEENDTGAFGVDVSKNVQISENAMLNNQNDGQDCAGGVVALLSCATNANVNGNFIWNKGVYVAPGHAHCVPGGITDPADPRALAPAFEIWGRDIIVQNNWMEYFSNEAVYLAAVSNVTVQQNKIRNASRMYHFKDPVNPPPPEEDPDEDDPPGVQVANCNEPKAKRNCTGNDSTCVVKNVTVINNEITNGGTLGQSYGVRFRNAVCGTYSAEGESMSWITLQGNYGSNRHAPACHAEVFSQTALTSLQCPASVRIGDTVDGKQCGTSGCQ